ncbi:hypothetical protein Efla_001773 [Eimeria flavescens]
MLLLAAQTPEVGGHRSLAFAAAAAQNSRKKRADFLQGPSKKKKREATAAGTAPSGLVVCCRLLCTWRGGVSVGLVLLPLPHGMQRKGACRAAAAAGAAETAAGATTAAAAASFVPRLQEDELGRGCVPLGSRLIREGPPRLSPVTAAAAAAAAAAASWRAAKTARCCALSPRSSSCCSKETVGSPWKPQNAASEQQHIRARGPVPYQIRRWFLSLSSSSSNNNSNNSSSNSSCSSGSHSVLLCAFSPSLPPALRL